MEKVYVGTLFSVSEGVVSSSKRSSWLEDGSHCGVFVRYRLYACISQTLPGPISPLQRVRSAACGRGSHRAGEQRSLSPQPTHNRLPACITNGDWPRASSCTRTFFEPAPPDVATPSVIGCLSALSG